MCTCYTQSFKILASFCSWASWFEAYLFENPQRHVSAWCGSFVKILAFESEHVNLYFCCPCICCCNRRHMNQRSYGQMLVYLLVSARNRHDKYSLLFVPSSFPKNTMAGPIGPSDVPIDWYSGDRGFHPWSGYISFLEIWSWNNFYSHSLPTAD